MSGLQPAPPNAVQKSLLLLALVYSCYLAKSFLLPLVLSLLFALLLLPIVNVLARLRVPRWCTAGLLIVVGILPLMVLSMNLVTPVQEWATKVPEIVETVRQRIEPISQALQGETAQRDADAARVQAGQDRGLFDFFRRPFKDPVDQQAAPAAESNDAEADAVTQQIQEGGLALATEVVSSAPGVLAQWMIFVVLLVFTLIWGPALFDACVELFPHGSDREQATVFLQRLQSELSRYVVVVTLVNIGLGIATGLALWTVGVDDPLIWGVAVALLNYAPYVGPVLGIIMLLVASIMENGFAWAALVPPLVYFTINLFEAQFVTPAVLGNRMRLNPLVLAVWLLFCGWLWGFIGVVIAVPLLVCFKLMAQQLGLLSRWVKVLESGT